MYLHMYVCILTVVGIDYELLLATLNKIYNLILFMLWCSDLNQAFKQLPILDKYIDKYLWVA